jgi:hypothetical protein
MKTRMIYAILIVGRTYRMRTAELARCGSHAQDVRVARGAGGASSMIFEGNESTGTRASPYNVVGTVRTS